MVHINQEIYNRKCRNMGYFRFTCFNCDRHFKVLAFDSVPTELLAVMKYRKKLNSKEPGIAANGSYTCLAINCNKKPKSIALIDCCSYITHYFDMKFHCR